MNIFDQLIDVSTRAGWNEASQIVLLCNFLEQIASQNQYGAIPLESVDIYKWWQEYLEMTEKNEGQPLEFLGLVDDDNITLEPPKEP